MFQRLQQVRQSGSPNIGHTCGAIVVGASEYIDLWQSQPKALELWDYLDDMFVQNASTQPIAVVFADGGERYDILAAQQLPISGRPYRQYTITNTGAGNIAAGEVTVNHRRLPPNIQPVVTVH